MVNFELHGKRYGKRLMMVETVRAAILSGRSIVIACPDQATEIDRLRTDFPNALFSTIGTWGIRVHARRGLLPWIPGK